MRSTMLIARFIQDITLNVNKHRASFAQQYMLQKGLKVFGNKGHEALMKEIDQLHKRLCFAPLKVKEMKPSKKEESTDSTHVQWYTTGSQQENGYLERTQWAQPPH
jgi:alkylated DNA repair dioxygenase AlkB